MNATVTAVLCQKVCMHSGLAFIDLNPLSLSLAELVRSEMQACIQLMLPRVIGGDLSQQMLSALVEDSTDVS